MKKLVIIILFLINNQIIYSHNFVCLRKNILTGSVNSITRKISTNICDSFKAIDVASKQALNRHTTWYFINNENRVDVIIERKLVEKSLKSPNEIYGPYIYVKKFTKIADNKKLIEDKYIKEWKDVRNNKTYRGAHHLINKYTLKIIWEQQKYHGIIVNLSDMQKDSPAIFHPFHGNPKYEEVFHNPIQQLYDYEKYGMLMTIVNILKAINELNEKEGFPKLPNEYIEGIFKEAELWCETYNLTWKKFDDSKFFENIDLLKLKENLEKSSQEDLEEDLEEYFE